MIKIILLLLVTLCSFSIETDKAAHLGVSYIITDVCETKLNMNASESFLTTFGIGLVKEMTDKTFDSQDLEYDMAGWALKRLVFEVKF